MTLTLKAYTATRRRDCREFVGYFCVSLIALAVDMALLIQSSKVLHPIAAATISFLAGVSVCYALSVRFVFSTRRYGLERRQELVIFLMVGLIGLGINDAVIYLSHFIMLLPLAFSKLLAAAVTFLFNFTGRKLLLFRSRALEVGLGPNKV